MSTELLMEYRSRVLIKGIVQHLTVDAFSKYNPLFVVLNQLSMVTQWLFCLCDGSLY